jgi:glutamate decarboxylase
MVHLAQVKNDSDIRMDISRRNTRASTIEGLEHICLDPPGEDEFTSAVYGSRFAAEDLPQHEMPEKEMPKEVAYRMIKDDLSLDGNPMLKLVILVLAWLLR